MTHDVESPAGGPAAAARPRRESFAALRRPAFRSYFAASALAMMADNIEHVVSYWVLFERFQSPVLGGVAVLTHWLPFLAFSVYSGALADRFDPRRLVQIAQLLFLSVSLGWGLLLMSGAMQVWHAVVLLTLHGMAGVLWSPASQLYVYSVVGREDLQSAVRLDATARQLGLIMGPAVGGGLMLLVGPGYALLINASIYLPLIIWLRQAPYTRPQDAGVVRHGGGFAAIADSLRQVSGNRVILSMIMLAGTTSLFVGNAFQAQMPEFAHDLGEDHAGTRYSMLLAANAAGALTGGLILESRGLLPPRPQTAFVLTLLWCFVITGFAAATSYPLALCLMFVAGFLNLSFNSMAQTLVQMNAPTTLRGRVIGLYNMSSNGLRAFSGVTVGVLGGLIGIHWSLALSAMALLAATAVLFAFSMRSR